MSVIVETSQMGLKELYNFSLGSIICLPALSIAVSLICDKSLKQKEKMCCLSGVLISCGLIIYSKNLLVASMVLNILSIMYYKHLKSESTNDFKIYTNTMIIQSLLIAILYSIQASLQ